MKNHYLFIYAFLVALAAPVMAGAAAEADLSAPSASVTGASGEAANLSASELPAAMAAHTLPEIFALIERSAGPEAAALKAQAAASALRAAKGSFYPQISAIAGAKANSGALDLFEPAHALKIGAQLDWLLYDAERNAAVAAAEQNAATAELAARAALADAKLAAAVNYFAQKAAKAEQQGIIARCEATDRAAVDAQKLARAGIARRDDELMLRAAAASCWANSSALDAKIAAHEAALSALAGAPVSPSGAGAADDLALAAKRAADDLAEASAEAAGQSGQSSATAAPQAADSAANSYALQLAIARAEAAQIAVRQANGAFLPKVFLRASSEYERAKLRTQNFGPLEPLIAANLSESSLSTTVALGASVNIFAGGAQSAAAQSARAMALAAASAAQAERDAARAKLAAANEKIRANLSALKAAQTAVAAANAAAKSAAEKHRAGLLGYADLLRALGQEQSARAQVAAAQAQAASAAAERAYYLGNL